jgi:hypothetical protein
MLANPATSFPRHLNTIAAGWKSIASARHSLKDNQKNNNANAGSLPAGI